MPAVSGETAIDKASGVRAGDLVAGSYRVERVLGTGGMGVVVAARHEKTGEAVAVKLLRSVDDSRAVERFFREARAMGKLDSEHVVRVRDAGSDGKKPYLVMDCLEGMDLSERAKRAGPLAVQEAVDYALQACEALSHAHSKGIVHRDIKPSNLFLHTVGDRTILKVLDFGISKVQTREVWEQTLTTTDDGGVLGSPPYMSPEQVRDPKTVDPRSDIWSLGIVLYKILSGAVPYDGESVGEVFAKVLERPYASLRVTTDVPLGVDAIVERCLAKDRDARWPHVGELALALAPFASPEYAALAPRIAQRIHDEGPTLERTSSIPDTTHERAKKRDEPKTMTLSEPPPEARRSAPPPALGSSPPPALGSSPSPALGSSPPPPLSVAPSPPLTAHTGSVSMDVVPGPPSRARVAAILLGVIGVAAGIGIGLAVRGSGSSTATSPAADPTAPTTTASAVVDPPASATAQALAPPGSVTAVPSAAASSVKAGGVRVRGTGRKPPSGTTAAPATGTGATTATRPELQPSPYPTAP